MRKFISGLSMALTMFTVIPLPCRWDDNARGMQLALLPVAGAIIGGLWALGVWIINLVNMPSLLGGALLVAIPNVMSGCIHLDGLMDTSDAIFSWRTLEERRRILKDSRVGAFAVITLAIVLMIYFGAASSITFSKLSIVSLFTIPVATRCCSSYAIFICKPLEEGGYFNLSRKGIAGNLVILAVFLASAACLSWLVCGIKGLIPIGSALAGYVTALFYAKSSLKGMGGDIAGFSMTLGELCGVVSLALIG